ncbi:uncharacterized protein BDV17DRAFT_28813 [Aspergillus undulatus]|uniref:uncharacterized protein n=1 Tax=Aspergillus undulatus TaxID=1810928 RepID=UPI003CCCA069
MAVVSEVAMADEEDSGEDAVIVDLVGPVEVSATKEVGAALVDKRRQMPPRDQGVAEVEDLVAADMTAVPRVATVSLSSPETDMATGTGETGTAMATAVIVTVTVIETAIATVTVTASAIGMGAGMMGDERGITKTTHTMTPAQRDDTEHPSYSRRFCQPSMTVCWWVSLVESLSLLLSSLHHALGKTDPTSTAP